MNRFKVRTSRTNTRIHKDSRTIPIWGSPTRGDGLDHGKWFRCWNCGFLCNKDRDALGDSQSRDGVVIEDYAQNPEGRNFTGDAILGLGVIASETDSEGDPIRYPLMISTKSTGCPFCHTLNWRGDY